MGFGAGATAAFMAWVVAGIDAANKGLKIAAAGGTTTGAIGLAAAVLGATTPDAVLLMPRYAGSVSFSCSKLAGVVLGIPMIYTVKS